MVLSRHIKVSLTNHESKKVGPTTIPEIEGINKKIFGYVNLFCLHGEQIKARRSASTEFSGCN